MQKYSDYYNYFVCQKKKFWLVEMGTGGRWYPAPNFRRAVMANEDPAVTRFRQYLRIKTISGNEDPKPDYRKKFSSKLPGPAGPSYK